MMTIADGWALESSLKTSLDQFRNRVRNLVKVMRHEAGTMICNLTEWPESIELNKLNVVIIAVIPIHPISTRATQSGRPVHYDERADIDELRQKKYE